MGRQAKIKKNRQQEKTSIKSVQKYDQTQFVEQFEKMGYQVRTNSEQEPKSSSKNRAPEIPEYRIEPQM